MPPPPSGIRSIPPSSPALRIPKAYESAPPVIRDRLPTLELADDDLLESEPVAVRPRSTPPPPPPLRSTVVPKGHAVVVPKIAALPLPDFDALPLPAASWEAPAAERIAPRLESVLDPTEVLFEGMYELENVDSSWQAASVCAAVLARALGARAVLVHSHDLVRRELRAIGVHGERTADLLGASELSDDDLVASAVICNEKPVTMRFDGELPRLAPRRLAILGAPRTLVAVPAMAWGRCVAIIEIIDADDRFAGRVADAALYVAERLAAYLSGRLAA